MATLQPPPPPNKTGDARIDGYLQSLYKWSYLFWFYQTNDGTTTAIDISTIVVPGMDGEDGEDGLTIVGPQGPRGLPGIGIPGQDGQDGDHSFFVPPRSGTAEDHTTLYMHKYIDFAAQATAPPMPPSGVARLHSATTQGFTRLEQHSESTTHIILGRDNVFIAKNTSGSDIVANRAVYVSGSTGNVPNIALAKSDSLTTLPSVGITLDAISNNAFGYVMKLGVINNVDTSAFSTGDRLWVSAATAGMLTSTRPAYPNYTQRMASVLVSGVGNGSLLVVTAPFIGGQEDGTDASSYTFAGTFKTAGYTVATLPAGTVGMRAYVTDATAPTFLGALVGGGGVTTPVFYNGAAWVSA